MFLLTIIWQYHSWITTNPSLNIRHLLHKVKSEVTEATKVEDKKRVAAATKLLEDWKNIKNLLTNKPQKKKPTDACSSITNYGVLFTESKNSVTVNNLPLKRDASNDGSSENWSWDSMHKEKKKKYVKAYLSSTYGDTDFGGEEDKFPKWTVGNINMTSLLREYRQKSIAGTQMRKHLSDSRALSLSYVFLLSSTDRCVLSLISSTEQATVIKDLNLKSDFKRVDSDVVIACRDMQLIVESEEKTEDEKEDQIHLIKSQSKNSDVKIASKIIGSLLQRLMSNRIPGNQREGEAAQIIEAIRPIFMNCIISQLMGVKHDWLTYHLVPHSNHQTNQVMIPDLVLFADPFSGTNFELCFVEVKRQGNHSNGHQESDLVKLGKEMQLALSKLVFNWVDSPEVVGILVEGFMATAYKMDLAFNGQYRMMKMYSFRFLNDNSDDILSLPATIEKLNHLKAIIQRTMDSLYRRIGVGEKGKDITMYIRKPCENPVATKIVEK